MSGHHSFYRGFNGFSSPNPNCELYCTLSEQQDESARPAISENVENIDQYDVVLIGHPIWWGMEPRIIDTFMESYDFSGKTLTNFCTSGGSGINASTDNLKALSPNANWLDGRRFSDDSDAEAIQEWINSLNLE